jgi:anhydro-N-acetylmuramic acid kinase
MSVFYIGLMSGTSMDGIDVALVSFPETGKALVRSFAQVAIPETIRSRLLSCTHESPLSFVAELDNDMARLFSEATSSLIENAGISPREVAAIGCHGQTLFHAPVSPFFNSIQVGNPSVIAECCKIPVVADFRRRDIAAGGQGAPLAPIFHAEFFSSKDESRCIANIGGIANISVLPMSGAPITGFDTGPGNCLLDAWIRHNKQLPYDEHGNWAAMGNTSEELLDQLLRDDFFLCPPPKSTGKDRFNLKWLNDFLVDPIFGALSPEDIQATLTELTAVSLADSILCHAPNSDRLLICGGGAHNTFLLERIRQHLPGTLVSTTETIGFEPDAVEAATFAWLAKLALNGTASSLPSVTGARHSVVLGAIYPS